MFEDSKTFADARPRLAPAPAPLTPGERRARSIGLGCLMTVLGFLSHMDTSPAVSGANVNPIIHKNYQGGDIVLPKDPTQVITVARNPTLKEMIGDDIITADGTTLLGSDDKSGIAAIMTMIDTLMQNPQIKHGTIAIAFTPDEEVGAGIDKFDIKGFGAQVAYTVDGESLGEISNETWSARTATVTFKGKSTHPGDAKGIMVNAMYALGDYLSRFPHDMLPETTEDRVGFVHPYTGTVDVEESSLKILLRDFEISGLDAKEKILRDMVAATQAKFPEVKISIDVKELDGYVGRYEGGPDFFIPKAILSIERKGDQLWMNYSTGADTPLVPLSTTKFLTRPFWATITFVKDEKGSVTQLIYGYSGTDYIARAMREK